MSTTTNEHPTQIRGCVIVPRTQLCIDSFKYFRRYMPNLIFLFMTLIVLVASEYSRLPLLLTSRVVLRANFQSRRGETTVFSEYPWVTRDVTKNQTKKLSILLSFYFHEVLQYLNTFTYTNFWFERVLRFAREDA